jgi:hypothetical protein
MYQGRHTQRGKTQPIAQASKQDWERHIVEQKEASALKEKAEIQ